MSQYVVQSVTWLEGDPNDHPAIGDVLEVPGKKTEAVLLLFRVEQESGPAPVLIRAHLSNETHDVADFDAVEVIPTPRHLLGLLADSNSERVEKP